MDHQRTSTILHAMQEASFPVGASFLSKKLQIPPATIGRCMSELEQNGLISKISNKGRILSPEGIAFLEHEEQEQQKEKNAAELILLTKRADKRTLMEILQTRKLLEGYTARLAASNATEDEIAELERLMLEHLHQINRGQLGSQIDLQIHLTISRIAKNRTIFQILQIMLTEDNVYTNFSSVADPVKHRQIKQHDAIIRAIREHNPSEAESAMELHLDQVMQDLEQYFSSDQPDKEETTPTVSA